MFRRAGVLTVLLVLVGLVVGCTQRNPAPSSRTPFAFAEGEVTLVENSTELLLGRPVFLGGSALSQKTFETMHSHNIHGRALGRFDDVISFNERAADYWAQGEYAQAEPLLVRALQLCEEELGAWHRYVAISLNSLAVVYQAQGAYDKAEPLLVRALAIDERELGPMDADVVNSLNNLAMLYDLTGAYAKAEPLYLRALEIREKALDAMHPDLATSLNNLGFLYWKQGDYAKAEPLYLRALRIHEKASGGKHPDVALSLNNLAGLYAAQGDYRKAEPLMTRALAIEQTLLGEHHPYVATMLYNLARLHIAQGAYAKAEPLEEHAAAIRERQLRLELARLSESRMRALMTLLQGETESVVSLHADTMPSSPQALALALTTVLRRKGRVLDALADNRLGLRKHLTRGLRDQLDELSAVSTELSNQTRAAFDPRTAASRATTIASLHTRFDQLEATLNEASAEFRVQSEPITLDKIQAALPRGAALVELVHYRRFDARRAKPWQEARYVAYLLPWQGPPRWVALGEAAPIDAAVDAVLATMHPRADANATRAALQYLDELVLAPLRALTDASHLILSPDGKLNLVPFEALVDSQGRYEMEQRLVSYVTSGRDLLRLAARRAPRSMATLVTDPEYGPPRSGAPQGLGTFRRLGGAIAEVAALQPYFLEARTLTGNNATKAALAAAVGPSVVHLVTHGFYARATAAAPWSRRSVATPTASTASAPAAFADPWAPRGLYLEPATQESDPTLSSYGDPTDALDRAGLAMAGANVRPDGIVSARELASYDWWGTQLVVLSACETGVGAVPSGEGVYGMRRALVLAGAESQVVSLWNVSDASTPALMQAFYGELARGTGRAEALRQAKLRLLQQRQFEHPYYWAAFIPAGDWTPLAPHVLKQSEHR